MTPLTSKFEDLSAVSADYEVANSWKSAIFGVPSGRPEVLISVHEEIEPLKSVWQALEKSGDGTPFQTYAWISAWQRHIGTKQGVKPAIVVGWDNDGAALFILPLGIVNGVVCHQLTWLGGDLADYNAPLLSRDFPRYVSPAQFPALWADIRDTLPTHHIVTLSRMPERVGEQANPMMALGGLRANASSAHMTMLKEDWATYYGEKRSSGSKKRDKQKRRKTEELGTVSLVSPQTAEEKLRTLDILMEQKAVTFARMGVANLFDKPGYRDFYREISTSEEAAGLIEIDHLAVGDTVAATAWGLSYGGRYHYVLASYDEKAEASRFGPGMILLMEVMARSTESGKTGFDFTVGDEGYKDQWCEIEIPLFDYVEPSNLVGWLNTGPRVAYLGAKRFIKQTPVLWQGFTRLRAAKGIFAAALSARA